MVVELGTRMTENDSGYERASLITKSHIPLVRTPETRTGSGVCFSKVPKSYAMCRMFTNKNTVFVDFKNYATKS